MEQQDLWNMSIISNAEIVRYELLKENEKEVIIQIPAYNDTFVLNRAEFNFFRAYLPEGFIYGRPKHKGDDKIYFVENGKQFLDILRRE